ncbi:hypothetical protein GCM10008018_07250 [Paenibacillus marchantiophytorum]|uniref:Uncharacterized protein n=1 Tax=Paenibacillus marchantiophytorum TaxID=1619310 RepID=A0ABQ2BPG8_9BACL|nr:hypothetical protein GCM10008018_07250 [Paenibacillus marchantiophytorum]
MRVWREIRVPGDSYLRPIPSNYSYSKTKEPCKQEPCKLLFAEKREGRGGTGVLESLGAQGHPESLRAQGQVTEFNANKSPPGNSYP